MATPEVMKPKPLAVQEVEESNNKAYELIEEYLDSADVSEPVATQPDHTIHLRHGFVCVRGPLIEKVAAEGIANVPKEAQEARCQRDGPSHHITLLTPSETSGFFESYIWADDRIQTRDDVQYFAQRLVDHFANAVDMDNMLSEGTGAVSRRVTSVGADATKTIKAFFQVITWPSAQEARRNLDYAERDLHVTLGFVGKDVHGVPKDRTTLLA